MMDRPIAVLQFAILTLSGMIMYSLFTSKMEGVFPQEKQVSVLQEEST